jgi:hypothetical protein
MMWNLLGLVNLNVNRLLWNDVLERIDAVHVAVMAVINDSVTVYFDR